MRGRLLLDRESELRILEDACSSAAEGRGQLIVVMGAAGSGKTELLAALAEQAEAAGLQVLSARGSQLEHRMAFGAIRQLLEAAVVDAPPADRDLLFADAAAPARWVINGTARNVERRTGVQYGFAALHGIYRLVTNLSHQAPMVLAVDDLHWVDRSSTRALAYLAHRVAALPVVLLVAMRPDEPFGSADLTDALLAEPDAVRLDLRPLGADAVAQIVRNYLPEADAEACAASLTSSGGNPLYLHELLATLARDGYQGDLTAAVHVAALPGLGAGVIKRVGQLGTRAVGLVRAMAVLSEGYLADASAVAGLDTRAAAGIAARLRAIDVLASADPFSFVHPLVRMSVYEAMSVTERDHAHQIAAARLRQVGGSAQSVAAHLAALRPSGSPTVASWLRSAAQEAIELAAPEAAARWLERALLEDSPTPPRAELLHEFGTVEVAARDPAAIEHLTQALGLAATPDARARIALELGEILVAAGMWSASLGALEMAAAVNGVGPEIVGELEAFRAVVRAFDPALVEAFDRSAGRLRRLATGDSWSARALAVLLANIAAIRGEDRAAARELVEHGLRDGALFTEHGAGGWASAQAIEALINMGEDERAGEVVEELARHADESGAVIGKLTADGYRGWLHIRDGDLIEAEAAMRPAIAVAIDNDMGMLVATAARFLTDVMLERTSLDDLARVLLGFEPEPAFLATCSGALLLQPRGRLRLLRGDRTGGVADLRAAASIFIGLRFGPTFETFRSSLALALPMEGRDEALALAEEDVALAEASGLPRPYGVSLRALGLLSRGRAGLEHLSESVRQLEQTSARLELARSLVAQGAALRRDGRRVESRTPLARGRDLAHQCGATRLVASAGQELLAAGARPRRISRTGLPALTPSELRVAQLAGAGRSNRQIAQELFISIKTVETHLTRVYAKLNLTAADRRTRLSTAVESGLP